jgi:hypothetical protein
MGSSADKQQLPTVICLFVTVDKQPIGRCVALSITSVFALKLMVPERFVKFKRNGKRSDNAVKNLHILPAFHHKPVIAFELTAVS